VADRRLDRLKEKEIALHHSIQNKKRTRVKKPLADGGDG
jgi:hypothetical protein